ncbi:MAG: ATP-binding protein [Microbacteriaceae bacterium]|nr:ATP-binding protein [Microbacteriaceae bacterium]
MSSGFVVDTHLLRELGDLLVGRDSTAILELVKNGYDADARIVRIDAQGLANPDEAVFTVEDDGNGMTAERFRSAFLRIAGRDKEEGERVSPAYQRSYTGQKGIGRLASQKLANVLEVRSTPNPKFVGTGPGVEARINWEEIDRQDDLHNLTAGLAVSEVVATGAGPGTTLTLRFLKRVWSTEDIGKFINEMQSAQPPRLLLGETKEKLAIIDEPLIGKPILRGASADDPGFELDLSGELASGDDLWPKAAEEFSWFVEIDVRNGRARYKISPTTSYASTEGLARIYSFEAETDVQLRFQARFYSMLGASTRRGPLKGFVRNSSGIRVYLEGFRVLPYAEYGDDWLDIDREYRSGARYYTIELDEAASDQIDADKKEALHALASNAYFGAVFLTTEGSPGLQSLINREGFAPGPTLTAIRQIVQNGVHLLVRVRRSVFNQRQRLNARVLPIPNESDSNLSHPERDKQTIFDPSGRTSFDVLAPHGTSEDDDRKIAAAVTAATTIAAEGFAVKSGENDSSVRQVVDGFNAARIALQAVQSFQPELRTLAGVGLQLGAFVHDINGMLASTTTIRNLLRGLLNKVTDAGQRNILQVTLRAADELAHTLARQSSYLTDVLSADPRRRRSQVNVRERLDSVLRFLATRVSEKGLGVHIEMSRDLRVGPMFPAEIMILLTNLLTNAIKNAAVGGNLWVSGRDLGESIEIVISNDGVPVNLDEAERWFLPFESTTTVVDEVLGQGMGLGLPIVRALTDDYRGDVRFVESQHGVGTAVRVLLPKKGGSN